MLLAFWKLSENDKQGKGTRESNNSVSNSGKNDLALGKEGGEENIREEFIGPMSKTIMCDPVITTEGETYERIFIEEWLSTYTVDPISYSPIGKTLVPNRSLQKLIEKHYPYANMRHLHDRDDEVVREKIAELSASFNAEYSSMISYVNDFILHSIPDDVGALKLLGLNSEQQLIKDLSQKLQIASSTNLLEYYVSLQVTLNGVFIVFSILASELSRNERKGAPISFQEALHNVSNNGLYVFALAGVGMDIVGSLFKKDSPQDVLTLKKGLNAMNVLFKEGDVTVITKISETLARGMTLKRIATLQGRTDELKLEHDKYHTVKNVLRKILGSPDSDPIKVLVMSDSNLLLTSLLRAPFDFKTEPSENAISEMILNVYAPAGHLSAATSTDDMINASSSPRAVQSLQSLESQLKELREECQSKEVMICSLESFIAEEKINTERKLEDLLAIRIQESLKGYVTLVEMQKRLDEASQNHYRQLQKERETSAAQLQKERETSAANMQNLWQRNVELEKLFNSTRAEGNNSEKVYGDELKKPGEKLKNTDIGALQTIPIIIEPKVNTEDMNSSVVVETAPAAANNQHNSAASKFAKYIRYQKMGLNEQQVRRMMKCDKCSEEFISEFFGEEELLPPIAALTNFIVKDRKGTRFGGTFVLQHSSNLSFIRIERHESSFLSMAADRILFSYDDDISSIRTQLIYYLADRAPDLTVQIEPHKFMNSLFSLCLQPADNIALFDTAFKMLKDFDLHPFPDYIMYDLSTAQYRRADDHIARAKRLTSSEWSTWKSPFGVRIEPFLNSPFEKDDIKVGILDDFSSSHGLQCREIIDAFDFAAGHAAGEAVNSSMISFHEYDFLGTITRRELVGDIELSATSNLITTTETGKIDSKDSRFIEARLSILLENLHKVVADNVRVLNMSTCWRTWFPEEPFNNMLIMLRKCFRTIRDNNCICVLAAGNDGDNLDNDFRTSKMDDNGVRWFRRSLFVAIAREEEFRRNMVVVGASGVFGQLCPFSNYGPESVSLLAPGEFVSLSGGEMTGTSAAAPLVAAAIIVMLRQFPRLSGSLHEVLRRLRDTLDHFTQVTEETENIRKCRIDGRINPSRAFRKDLIGPYGLLGETDFLETTKAAILKIQRDIRQAEELEMNSTFKFRNLSLMSFGDYWVLMCEEISNEQSIYQNALSQLNAISFDNEIAVRWQKFEVQRIRNLLVAKECILAEWSNAISLHFPEFLRQALCGENKLFRTALDEVRVAKKSFHYGSSVCSFWGYVEYWANRLQSVQ